MYDLLLRVLANLQAEEEGQTMVEYGLILALISIAAIVILTALGSQLIVIFTSASTAL